MSARTGPSEVHPSSTPARGLSERIRDSLWITWTFTIFFNWIALFWIGFRARNARWVAWGYVYALPFVVLMAVMESDELYESWPGDVAFAAVLILGLASIIHAFVIRRTYIAQRRALLARHHAQTTEPTGRVWRGARSLGVVALYLAEGLFVGTFVLFGAFATATDDEVRIQIVGDIALAGAVAYLALLGPVIWFWGTNRVWWLVSVGGIGIGTLALVSMWVTITHTGDPAF